MEIVSFEVYGRPSDSVLERMQQIAGSGIRLYLKSRPIGGYIRLQAG
jgi:hypothetical protein